MVTVIPDAWSSFSLKRTVLKIAGQRAHRADARLLEAAHHPAHAEELRQVRLELRIAGQDRVLLGDGERDAVLIEVVGQRNLAAERIPALRHVELVRLVGVRLHQHRHGELRQLDAVGDAAFRRKDRQQDQDAVDAVTVGAEVRRPLLGVVPGLQRAHVRRGLVRDDDLDAQACKLGDHLAPRRQHRLGRKEVARADDQREGGWFLDHGLVS